MERIAKFQKVTEQLFLDECNKLGINDYMADDAYQTVSLPERATSGSAGYDFHIPFPIRLEPGQSISFPTAVRCEIAPGWFLMIVPKSGLGYKYRCQLDNTVGIIDSDYYYSDNEGQMAIKMTNCGNVPLELAQNAKVAQGIFLPYGITTDDEATGVRNGGFGSTGA